VYVNIVGGMRLTEPAVDLATVVAIASGMTDTPVSNVAVIGEVGLGGEVRSITQVKRRVAEAQKLGMERCVVPQRNMRDLLDLPKHQIIPVATVVDTLQFLGCAK